MTITLVNMGDQAEVVMEGRLDSNTSPETERLLMNAVDRFDKISLNFSKLEYASSAGLRTLKKLYIAMKQKNGQLTIKNVNKMVMEVFEMTGFVGLLKIE